MNQPEKKDPLCKRELGTKLANFRRKLAIAIGQKKITQTAFGEMCGGYSGRTIASYELGDVDPPASLFYLIWKTGHSIDAILGEGDITDAGRATARELYERSTTASLKTMDRSTRERLLREVTDDKRSHDRPIAETSPKTSGKRKASVNTSRKTKKR